MTKKELKEVLNKPLGEKEKRPGLRRFLVNFIGHPSYKKIRQNLEKVKRKIREELPEGTQIEKIDFTTDYIGFLEVDLSQARKILARLHSNPFMP